MKKLTVGITTCYGQDQLLETVTSILYSNYQKKFDFIIIADNVPVPLLVKQSLAKSGIKLIENKVPTSAFAKQRQILALTKSEYIVLTQDDVLFSKNLLAEIVRVFDEREEVTFVGCVNEPLKPATYMEAGINVGTRLNNKIGKYWRGGDNYLAVLGRVMAFRTEWLKKLNVHDESVSLDAYLYFENKIHGGKYVCLWDDPVYFRNPTNMEEHMRKSSRFQNSFAEMLGYNKFENLETEYKIPLNVIVRAAAEELIANPLDFLKYCGVFLHTRLLKQKAAACLTALWETDLSTKDIHLESLVTQNLQKTQDSVKEDMKPALEA